jgi:aminoglycoside phosphotransferase (APT) family kinase protein
MTVNEAASITTDAAQLRDQPTAEFIESLRTSFPTEAEMDRVLTEKMITRISGKRASEKAFSLDALMGCMDALLADQIVGSFATSNARWLSGGASKIQVAFSLDWTEPEVGRTTTELVIRLEPEESVNATSRRREYQLLSAAAGTVPVPRVYWLDEAGTWFPQPAIIYAFAHGVTKPSSTSGRVSGIGQAFAPELRAKLAPQFVEHLARIHTMVIEPEELSAFTVPPSGSKESALWQLNRARRIWDEDRGPDLPIFDVASNWLERNLPELDSASVLHGDFRAGNFLFDESTDTITTWLDWERGYIGDRHRDLAWTTTPTFGNYAEDGKTFLVSGLIPLDEFFALYTELSGFEVDQAKLRYYRIFNNFQLMVTSLASAYRVVRLGKSHQDVLLTSVEGVGYIVAEDIRRTLEEEIG